MSRRAKKGRVSEKKDKNQQEKKEYARICATIAADRAAVKLRRKLRQPERMELENTFAAAHAGDSDEQLINYLKEELRRRGKHMKPLNTVGYVYLEKRIGSWSRMIGLAKERLELERREEKKLQAGIKEADGLMIKKDTGKPR